jgi:16S rRNA (uracil1498-N3)-methyltransferase
MRVFLLPEASEGGREVEIQGPDFHYLAHVLRRKTGDRFQGADPRGNRWECRITELGTDRLRLELERPARPAEEVVGLHIRLIQALPKGRKMDLIVRQATEAGVREIWPVFSRHSLARIADPADRRSRRERWLRIAREAAQQSGGGRLPDIEEPVVLEQALDRERAEGEVRLIFHQDRLAAHSLHSDLAGSPRWVTLLIGPEGGFAEAEVGLAQAQGFLPITLGERVWRTETAALFAVAAVQTVIEEREAWKPA